LQRFKTICLGVICMLLLAGALTGAAGCSGGLEQPGQDQTGTGERIAPPAPVALAMDFARYQEVPVDYLPAVEPYTVEPGLANVTNRDMFFLPPEAERLLEKNGFVVVPNYYREFFMLYEINRYEPVPSFITTDSMLHNYHLFFNYLLRVTEKEKLVPELKELSAAMLPASEAQYEALRGTDWENAAKRNMGFFAVASRLMDENSPVPGPVQEVVAEELKLIESRSRIEVSPLMNMGQDLDEFDALKEDYTQYIPRGHYDGDEMLEAYFKTMMWYGRLTFRLQSEDETRSAVLITLALAEGDNSVPWDKIYQPSCFFVGRSDDLSYLEYRALLEDIYGSGAGLEEITASGEKWETFMKAAAELDPPQINSIPIFDADIQPDRQQEIMGFRFMGQRFTLDASIFQRLIYREVGENSQGERRMLPRALDVPAAMGSQEAYTILEDESETDYSGYPENMQKMRDFISTLNKETWVQNLYWGWLYTLDSLLGERGEGYPSFMQNTAWTRKNLNTFLSSWTELKHDTVLYAKQVYAEMGGGMEGVDDRGYVEPNPQLYARLAALVKMTREGLDSRDLLEMRDYESLERLEQLALFLKEISEKQLSGVPLTDEEYDLIRSYGGQLEHFWLEALRDKGVDHRSAIFDNPAALVVDVATDPGGQVLQQATGHIFEVYAVVPVEGSLRIARGGVFSHYEFAWPMQDRLTNKKWHELLDTDQVPPLARWTEDFIAP